MQGLRGSGNRINDNFQFLLGIFIIYLVFITIYLLCVRVNQLTILIYRKSFDLLTFSYNYTHSTI